MGALVDKAFVETRHRSLYVPEVDIDDLAETAEVPDRIEHTPRPHAAAPNRCFRRNSQARSPPRRPRMERALMSISQAITSDLYLEDLLKLIVMVTANVTGVAICSLWLINEDEDPPKIHLKATQSIDPEYI